RLRGGDLSRAHAGAHDTRVRAELDAAGLRSHARDVPAAGGDGPGRPGRELARLLHRAEEGAGPGGAAPVRKRWTRIRAAAHAGPGHALARAGGELVVEHRVPRGVGDLLITAVDTPAHRDRTVGRDRSACRPRATRPGGRGRRATRTTGPPSGSRSRAGSPAYPRCEALRPSSGGAPSVDPPPPPPCRPARR